VRAQEKTELARPAHSNLRVVPVQPTVSIVIIFLNAQKYLREAIDSVFAQTYSEWELLLVDDGSSDGSTEMALSYAQRFPGKVYYLEHERHQNKGMSASRNLGINHARGEFVAMLDADDVWLTNKLAKQVAFMRRHAEVGLIANPAFYWYEDGVKKPQPMALLSGVLPSGAWVPEILENDDNAACPSSVLIRKALLNQLGGFEESFRGVFEDQIMWFKISLNSSIYYHPEHLALYRIHSASCCTTTSLDDESAARVVLYSRLSEMLNRQTPARCGAAVLRRMARSKLCDALLESIDQPSATLNSDARRSARLQSAVADIRAHGHLLGPLFFGLCLLGLVSRELARSVSTRIFWFCRVTYAEGYYKSIGALSRRLIKAIPKSVMGPIKPFARPVLQRLRTVKARLRLGAGLEPLSYFWGSDRGLSIHRYYLEQFLRQFASDIRGHCLEFQDPCYAPRFGGTAVDKLDVLHIDDTNPLATIVANLTQPNDIPSNTFDCIVCTHVLHIIEELDKAVVELHRILKPGGVLLAAVPQVSMCDPGYHELWRFTTEGLAVVLGKGFGRENVTVQAYGNSLTAAGEIRGLVAHEFNDAALNYNDPRFAVEVCARASKAKN
jgi:glycosyltransferase involved in cell wall biosynthesis/SAM-dependent methyltransferase